MSTPVIPKIALVGRPNVGKSTLFNRICGRRKAITDGRPGSTRDRNYAQVSWQGAGFELVDTGGLLLQTDDPLLGPAADQARLAIDESDRVLFVVDGRAGLLPDDSAIAKELRRRGKSVVVAVNKVEGSGEGPLADFASLGFGTMLSVSAEHGLGVGDLLDEALRGLPRMEVPEETRPLRIALVGRPNVGKSSLLNKLLGQERSVVSAVPGTTRDSVDSLLVKDGKHYLFVDTAGIRRQRLLKDAVDYVSVVQAKKSIEHSDVAIVLLSAEDGLREMDAVIAGIVQEAGRGIVLAVNKWDMATDRGLTQKAFSSEIERHLKFLPWAPVVYMSAKTGKGLTAVLLAADRVRAQQTRRITTGELNRILLRAQQGYAPKAEKGNAPVKILYGTQVGIAPPTFVISLNHPVNLHFSYKRYLENQIREEFGFGGTPVVLKVRTRKH